MTAEEWRRVEATPRYEVSNLGRVRSWYWAQSRGGPSILSGPIGSGGYPAFALRWNGKTRTTRIHRAVAAAFLGACPEGMVVRHLDGDSTNNMLANLAYGTPAENNADTLRHGRDWHLKKTHCPQGHEYTEANTYSPPGRPHRECRTCRAANSARRTSARREARVVARMERAA